MAFEALTVAETDVKSPMDDRLWEKVRLNFDDLDSRVVEAGAAPFFLELVGKLSYTSLKKRSVCGMIINEEYTPTKCRFGLKKSGSSALAFDIRKHTSPRSAITEIAHQYSGATQSVSVNTAAVNTQSIARNASQISTQSISFAKANNAITSIILLGTVEGLGTNLVQVNLTTLVDSDTAVGDTISVAGATSGGNNGTFVVVEKNRGGYPNVVVSNASGVAQTGAAGNFNAQIMSYNYTNPVDTANWVAGQSATFASHSNAANDGAKFVYAVNQAGNNIWVKNGSGVVQAGVAGTSDTNFFKFALSGAADTGAFVVGESVLTASHTNPLNDGLLQIMYVNQGGNNLVLYNTDGVVQGGAAGTINTRRWNISMPTDPSADCAVNDLVYLTGHTNPLNDGVFTVLATTSALIVIYNANGVAQGGAAGNVYTTRKIVKFASDQSAYYTTLSFVELAGCVNRLYNYYWAHAPFQVLQINRGGGANYNIVIQTHNGAQLTYQAPAQASPAGYVQTEMKSIFSVQPTLAADLTSLEQNQNVTGVSTSLLAEVVPAGTALALYITSYPSGDPQDLSVTLR